MRTSSIAAACLFALGLALGVPSLPAQDKGDSNRLQQLLQELRSLSTEAWKTRLAELEESAGERRARAAELRQQAAKLQAQAAREEAEAEKFAAHAKLLKDLQKLLSGLPNAQQEKAEPEKVKPDKTPPAERVKPGSGAMPEREDPRTLPEFVAYDAHVRDLLEESCSVCHDSDDPSGGLDVTSFASLRQGGGSGETLVPGRPEQSRLYRMITRQERPFMPKDTDPLPKTQIDLIRRWIEQGAAEQESGARVFVARRKADAEAAADAASHAAEPGSATAPMPAGLPVVALKTAERSPPVKCMARSPTAPLLALPGMSQVLLLGEDLEEHGVLPCALQKIEVLAFSEDGTWILAAGGAPGRRGGLVLYDVRTGESVQEVETGRDVLLAAAVHRGAGLLAFGGPDKTIRVHSAESGEELYTVRAHEDWILAMAFSPDGSRLATADRAGVLHVWETERGRNVHSLRGHAGAIHAVAFASDELMASAGADGTLRAWDLAKGEPRWRKTAHRGEALALAAGRSVFATGGSDGRVRVWAFDGAARTASNNLGDWVYAVVVTGDGEALLGGDWVGRVHRFELKSKKVTAVATPLRPRS